MTHFIFALSPIHRPLLAPLRTVEGLFMAEGEDLIWLRYSSDNDKLPLALDTMPWQERYITDQQRLLYRYGHAVPERALPALSWELIHRLIQVELPVPVFPAPLEGKISLALVPLTQGEQPVQALLADWNNWAHWVEQAPEVRLNRLRYAASQQKALITGTPLPPIEGVGFWAIGQLLLPAGQTINHPSLIPVLERHWGNAPDDLIVVMGHPLEVHCLSRHNFQPARRSSVRATTLQWHDD